MTHIELKQLYKNNRYRMFELEGEYYLLDCDSNPLYYFFPFLVYLLKLRCYRISKEDFEELLMPKELQERYLKDIKKTPIVALCAGFSSRLLYRIIEPYDHIDNKIVANVLFGIVIVACLMLRYFYTKKHDLGKYHLNSYIDARFFPSTWKMRVQRLYVLLFISSILLFTIALVVDYGMQDIALCYGLAVFLIFYLFINIIFLGIGDYTIKVR